MFRSLTYVSLGAALAMSWPHAALAQQKMSGVTVDVESIRELLLTGFEQNKLMDLDFARAIPDSALRWSPTPSVRDFAEQVEHAAVDNAFFVASGVLGVETPVFGDTAAYLNDKDALARVIEDAYAWVMQSLRELPPDELLQETELFRQRMPKWRVYLQALEHAYWTRGQLVPYFRAHGLRPPRYRSF